MSTSRAFEDVIKCMVNAAADDEYARAIDALKNFFEGLLLWPFDREPSLDNEVRRCSFSLLGQLHRDMDKRLQERGRKVLKDLDQACLHYYYRARQKNSTNYTHRYPRPLPRPRIYAPVAIAIVQFIKFYSEDASAAHLGFEILCNGWLPYPKDISQNTANVAVNSMIRHENDPVVQEYVMRFLSYRCRSLDGDINYPNVLRLFLQAMRNHSDNSKVLVAACKALSLFCNKYELIISVEWPPATILQALNNHVHCTEVQESACDCLGSLLEGVQKGFSRRGRDHIEANLPTPVGEDFFLAGRDYIEAVLQAMQTHPTNERVQYAALHVLERMTDETTSLDRIIQGGGVDLLIRSMRIFKEEVLCHRAAKILKLLLGCSTDIRMEAIELGVIPMLLGVVRTNWSWVVFASVCDTLNDLFLENIDNAVALQIANEGGIKLIVDTIVSSIIHGNWSRVTQGYASYRHELKDGDILAHLAMFPGDDGRLPLHCVVDHGLFPSSEGQDGKRPHGYIYIYTAHRKEVYHYHKDGMAVLEHLLKVYPEAATVRDGSGRLPLHIAIGLRAKLSVLELLLHAAPDTGEAVCRCRDDVMLNFPPVLMAAASDCDLECIFALLRYAPRITKRQVTFTSATVAQGLSCASIHSDIALQPQGPMDTKDDEEVWA